MDTLRERIENVKINHDIVEVIKNSNFALTKEGEIWKMICPFHDEATPSFKVYPKSQRYHCFGCCETGDVLDFLMKTEGKTLPEALGALSEDDYDLSDEDIICIENNRIQEDILTATAAFYHASLCQPAKDYLINVRGLTPEIIENFMIGYADGGLFEHLADKGYPLERCLAAGVISNSSNPNDYFNGQIILPIIKNGKVVFITGRSLTGAEPRYLNLRSEMTHLFNEDALEKQDFVIVTEGIFDSLSAIKNGYAAVSLLGTSLKESHVNKFNKCETIYVCLDGDATGKAKSLSIANRIGRKTRIVTLPNDTDLNEFFLVNAPDAFKKLLEEAHDAIEFQIQEIAPSIKKTNLFEKLKPILDQLASIETPTAETYLSDVVARHFDLTVEELNEYRHTLKNMRKDSVLKEGTNSGNDSAPIEDKICRNKFTPLSAIELENTVQPDISWLVEKYLPKGRLVLLCGSPKAGKTTWLYWLAKAIASGEPFHGFSTEKTRILILALEEHHQDVRNRIKLFGIDPSMVDVHIGSMRADVNNIHEIHGYVLKNKIGLIIVDTLAAFWTINDENNAAQTRQALTSILSLARDTGAAIILNHHTTKIAQEDGRDIRGSGDIFANADVAIMFRKRGIGDVRQRVLEAHSRFSETPKKIVISLAEDGYVLLGDADALDKKEQVQKVEDVLTSEPTDTEIIAESVGIPPGTVRTHLKQLHKANKVGRTGSGKRGDPYKYFINDSAQAGALVCGNDMPQIVLQEAIV